MKQRFQHRVRRIVKKQEDMRQLDRRIRADRQTGG